MITHVLVGLIRVYQRFISPMLGPRCRYYPSCSQYGVDAITIHGPLKGTLLAVWRLLRCNPLTDGGVDHVPEPGQWRYHYPSDVPRFVIDEQLAHTGKHGSPCDQYGDGEHVSHICEH